jgi:hypothetical protein
MRTISLSFITYFEPYHGVNLSETHSAKKWKLVILCCEMQLLKMDWAKNKLSGIQASITF